MELTQDYVKKYFDYNDGKLFWKEKISKYSNIQTGDRAGSYHKGQNRYVIGLLGVQYNLSRIIFLWHNGYLPPVVDHKNHITTDDRIENLRPASYTQNNSNSTSQKNSSSKYLGVSFFKKGNIWMVKIRVCGKNRYLGSFKNEDDAAKAYNEAAIIHHGEFANLNIIQV